MKQTNLLKTFLLLCALVVGSTCAWADDDPELTLDFTTAWTAGDDNSDGEKVFTKTVDETTYTISGKGTNFKFNSGYFYFGKTNAYIKLPQVDFDVEKIEVVGNSGASGSVKHNIFVGSTAVSTEVTGLNATTSTFEIGSSYQAANTQYILKVTSNHNAQITYVKYYKKTSSAPVSVTGVSVDPTSWEMEVGDTKTLTATVLPSNASDKSVTWESDNETVATVSNAGVVTAVAAGTATITVTTTDGSFTASCDVTVNAAPVVAATLDFTDAGWGFPSSYTTTEETYTNDGYTITFGASNGHKKMVASSVTTGIIFGKKDATLSLPAFDFNVNKIKVYGISGASGKVTFNIFVGDDAVSTEVTGATGTQTFDIAEGKQTAGTVYTIKLTNDNNCQISKIEIFGYVPVTISAAGLATLTIDAPLDFTSVDGIEAYIAKENGSKIELEKVNKVPAGTGVLLRSVSGEAKAADVPVATTADDVTGNLFKRGTGAAVATDAGEGKTNYVLGKHDGKVGFYKAGGMVVATNKAYLQTTVAAARIDIDFDGDVTAIETVKAEKANNEYYNLAGQRVANPTKGLYIVNGKKVIIK